MARNLTEGNMSKNFIRMAIPLVLSGLCSQAFNVVDMAVAGQVLGHEALAAVGGTSSFLQFMSSLFWGFATGVSLYAAKLYGSGRFRDTFTMARFSAGISLILGATFATLGILLRNPIFNFLKIKPDIWEQTLRYYVVYLAGIGFMVGSFAVGVIFHSVGDTLTPLLVTVSASLLNVGGNFFFLFCTNLGVGGLALASVLSAAIAMAVKWIFLRKTFREMNALGKFKLSREMVFGSLRYGLPCMAQQSALYLSSVAVQPAVNEIGPLATAGYAVAMKVYALLAAVFQNYTKGISSFVAQSLGAKKYDKIKRAMPVGWLQSTLFTLPFLIFCYFLPERVASVFFREDAGAAMEFATAFSAICLPFLFFAIFANLFHAYYRGTGALGCLLFCTGTYTLARIVLSYAFQVQGIEGIYRALNLSWIAESVCAFTVFLSGIWRPKAMKDYEMQTKGVKS